MGKEKEARKRREKRRREGWKGEWVGKGTEKRQMADTMLRSCTELLFCDRPMLNKHFNTHNVWCSRWLIHSILQIRKERLRFK